VHWWPTAAGPAELQCRSPERADCSKVFSRLTASLALRLRPGTRDACCTRSSPQPVHLAPDARLRPRANCSANCALRLGQAAGESRRTALGGSPALCRRAVKAPNTTSSRRPAAVGRAAARCNACNASSARARLRPSDRQSAHLDPAAVLERGYSVVRDGAGRIVLRGGVLLPATSRHHVFGGRWPMHASSDLGRNRDRRSSRLQSGSLGQKIAGRGCARSSGRRL